MKAMNNKTSSHFEIVSVANTLFGRTSIIVLPPKYLECFRCTVIFQGQDQTGSVGYLSTVPNQNEMNTLRFSTQSFTNTGVPPAIDDTTIAGIQTFVFDRLGVGYMVDNFYVSAKSVTGEERFVFIWEGNIRSNE